MSVSAPASIPASISASMPGGASPSQAMSLRGLIRDGSRVLYKSALTRKLSRKGSEKAIELKLLPLLPLIMAASALLYHEGQQLGGGHGASHGGHGKQSGGWRRMLMEAGVGYAVIENSKGVYPLWGLALSAYRAGQEETVLGKLQALASTVITLVMGYTGVNLFAGVTEAGIEMEEQELRQYLSHQGMQNWAKRLAQHPDEEVRLLGESMQTLKQKLDQQDALYAKGARPNWKVMQPLRSELASLKSDVHGRLQDVTETLIRPSGLETMKRYGLFRSFMTDSQQLYVKATRLLNPLFGYVVVGLMAGSGLAAYVRKKLAERYPNLKTMHSPVLFDRSVTLLPPAPAAHGTQPPGPYMVWPDVGNGVLH